MTEDTLQNTLVSYNEVDLKHHLIDKNVLLYSAVSRLQSVIIALFRITFTP